MYSEGGIWTSLEHCVGLFFILFSLLGAVMCLVYRGLSPWLFLAMAGFLGEVFLGVVRQVGGMMMRHDDFGLDLVVISIFYLVLGVLGLLASALILMGFALALGDVQRKLSRARSEGPDLRPRIPPPNAVSPFRERNEGSPDIQR
jgi:hypothetical protein